MVTQKDIAQNLGVSRETVKFVLNGNGKVAAGTRERVLREAERLGYSATAHMNARSLAARRNGGEVRTYAIGVLCSRSDEGRSHHTLPYFLPFWEGVEDEAAERGLEVALYLHRPGQLPRLLRDGDVDGVVLLTPTAEAVARQIHKPVVALGCLNTQCHSVFPDGKQGMRLAVEHLWKLGHRRIAYLGVEAGHFEGATRLEGFREAVEREGALQAELVEATVPGASAGVGREGMRRLLARSRDFTALVCYNDALALAAIEVMTEAGIAVPQQVSVVGFDGTALESPLGCGLTSVGFDAYGMGRKAVEIIVTGEEELRTEIFPVYLVERGSTRGAERREAERKS